MLSTYRFGKGVACMGEEPCVSGGEAETSAECPSPDERKPCCRRRGGAGAASVEPAVLAALLYADGYGYDLRKVIRERTGGVLDVDVGGMYRALRRLEDEGAVESRWCEDASGPKRREYRLTAVGVDMARQWLEIMRQRLQLDVLLGDLLEGGLLNMNGKRRMNMSDTLKLAVPTMGPAGLESERSGHFGHCDCFTIVTIANGEITEVAALDNPPHEEGGCLRPVSLLANAGVDAIVAAGMGMRPMMGFADAGITVYFENQTPNVGEVAKLVAAGNVPTMGPENACHHH